VVNARRIRVVLRKRQTVLPIAAARRRARIAAVHPRLPTVLPIVAAPRKARIAAGHPRLPTVLLIVAAPRRVPNGEIPENLVATRAWARAAVAAILVSAKATRAATPVEEPVRNDRRSRLPRLEAVAIVRRIGYPIE